MTRHRCTYPTPPRSTISNPLISAKSAGLHQQWGRYKYAAIFRNKGQWKTTACLGYETGKGLYIEHFLWICRWWPFRCYPTAKTCLLGDGQSLCLHLSLILRSKHLRSAACRIKLRLVNTMFLYGSWGGGRKYYF
uniref:Uncharacterized protein n=1 Tax=Megaselia scalaris TaxID=36166 RepID=T1GY13_MEGSC